MALWLLPIAVVTVSDWFVSGLSLVKSSPVESLPGPQTCQSARERLSLRTWIVQEAA